VAPSRLSRLNQVLYDMGRQPNRSGLVMKPFETGQGQPS
jgi:hypothetical protein